MECKNDDYFVIQKIIPNVVMRMGVISEGVLTDFPHSNLPKAEQHHKTVAQISATYIGAMEICASPMSIRGTRMR